MELTNVKYVHVAMACLYSIVYCFNLGQQLEDHKHVITCGRMQLSKLHHTFPRRNAV